MQFRQIKLMSAIILLADVAAIFFFFLGTTYAWNYFYIDNSEYRLLLWGYVKTEPGHSRIKSYKDFDNFAELAALISLSHFFYVIVGIIIAVHDSKKLFPSITGHLRRTNFITSMFFFIYSLYQIILMLLWIFLVNDIKNGDEKVFYEKEMARPKMGFWFSLTAIFCQLFGTVLRTLLIVFTKN